MWELAGYIGVHPDPYTLKQLYHMHQGRLKSTWDQTCDLLALLMNLHRKEGAPAIRASSIHPIRRRQSGRSNFTSDTVQSLHKALSNRE